MSQKYNGELNGVKKSYFLEDKRTGQKRRTAIFADTAKEAKKQSTRPPTKYAKVAKVRPMTEAEKKAAKKGWVSSKVSKDFDNVRGFGPKPKK